MPFNFINVLAHKSKASFICMYVYKLFLDYPITVVSLYSLLDLNLLYKSNRLLLSLHTCIVTMIFKKEVKDSRESRVPGKG